MDAEQKRIANLLPLCVDCGACCIDPFAMPTYPFLEPHEAAALTETERDDLVRLAFPEDPDDDQLAIRTRKDELGRCRCAALNGTIGKRVACRIYDRVPQTCTDFERGSDGCLEARRDILGIPIPKRTHRTDAVPKRPAKPPSDV
jgi:Fe-S-cluster containining protein